MLITGCSSGIGRALAGVFLENGWVVFATGPEERPLDGLAERGARTATVDVRRESDVTTVVDQLIAEEGKIDCLVNNAGYCQLGPVEDVSTEHVVRQFEVNVFGPHRLVRAVLPHMRSRDAGRIVNVSSVLDRAVVPGVGLYAASKFALRAMSDALRQELHRTGVDVVTVEPWVVATDFFERAVQELRYVDHREEYDDLYRVLESLTGIDAGTFSVGDPRTTAHAIYQAATAKEPRPYYRLGPWAKVGSLVGIVVSGRLRDRTARIVVDLLSRCV